MSHAVLHLEPGRVTNVLEATELTCTLRATAWRGAGVCVRHKPRETALGHGEELRQKTPHIPDQGYTQLHRHLLYPYF